MALVGGLAGLATQAMQGQACQQIIEAQGSDVIGLSAMRSGMADECLDMGRDVTVTEATPVQRAGAWHRVCTVQRLHEGLVAAAVAGDKQGGFAQLIDQCLAQRGFLLLQLVGRVLEQIVAVVAMHRNAKQFALLGHTAGTALRVDPDLDGAQLEIGRRARRQAVEVRRPDGVQKIGFGQMTKQSIAYVGHGLSDLFSKESATIVRDREAFADIEAVFSWRVLGRIGTARIEPALNLPPDTVERQFGELFLEARVVGQEDAALPFPNTGLGGRKPLPPRT